MHAIVIFHSTTGNTRLAAQYLIQRLIQRGLTAETWDIVRQPDPPDLNACDLVGFGFPVMEWHPTYAIQRFVASLPTQQDKPAFVFATCGGMPGHSLHMLGQKLAEKGLVVIGGRAVTSPSNWPLMRQIAARRTAAPQNGLDRLLDHLLNRSDRPSALDRRRLDRLIDDVLIRAQEAPRPVHLPQNWLDPLAWLGKIMTPEKSRQAMGDLAADETRCQQCGICARNCPAQAITLIPYPIFETERCDACWACYNNCPEKAIYTSLIRDRGHYPGPSSRAKSILA